MSVLSWSTMPMAGETRPAEHPVSVVRADASGRFVRVALPAKTANLRATVTRTATVTPGASINQIVEETSRRYGVDPLLVKSVIHVESNANPLAASPKGAQGLMQLIPSTARRFGVANALDPKQNIEGGVRYLKYLQSLYPSDQTLSIAAYNSGEGAVAKYKTVPPYPETLGYVQKVSRQYARMQNQGNSEMPTEHHLEQYTDAEGRLYLRTR